MVGDAVPVTVLRGGSLKVLNLKIGADSLDKMAGKRVSPFLEGVVLQNYRDPHAPHEGAGVAIVQANPKSLAYQIGLRPGDVIVGANDRPVQNLTDLKSGAGRAKEQLQMRVFRNGQFYIVPLR